jgi:hypothetical protein
MILMLAPAANMTFASMPSGSTYVSNSFGLIQIASGSVADQLALAAAGCRTLSPIPGGATTAQNGTNYVLQTTDQGNQILFNASSAVAVALPNSLPVGFIVQLFQIGTGQITASAASGASVVTPNTSSTPNQYSSLLCIVVSNSTGSNAEWDVIANPLQTGGLIGAASLGALYTQDASAHYAPFTVAQVLNDSTGSNNGTWLKTGSGNGSGNWTQESALTLSGLNTAMTAFKQAPPQQILSNANAVRNRFSMSADVPGAAGDRRNEQDWTQRLYRSSLVYNTNVYSAFGEPQALLLSESSAGSSGSLVGAPVGGYWISVADLETAGIVPGNSTYISAQIAIDIASAVNQTLDQVSGSGNGQCALILRYAGPGATQELYHNATTYDIWFLNAQNPNYDNVPMTDAHYIGVFSSSMVTTADVKGYKWQNVWLPATYGGFALTGIALICYGTESISGQLSSIQACLASVVGGTSIITGQAYFNADDRPASFVPATDVVNTLDVASADKVIVLGDSIGLGFYQPINKAWINKVSLFSDWNFENYSVSGQTYQTLLSYVLTDSTNVNSFWFGGTSFRDYKGSRVLLMSEGNDSHWETQAQFANDLRLATKICRDFGMTPTICGEYLNIGGYFANGIQTLMRSVAEEMGVDYLDLRRHGKLFAPATQNAAEFVTPHPGVRSNHLHSDPVEKYLKGLDGPRKSFKIFRRRPTFTVSSIDQLMIDSFYDRATVFEEINVGHAAMTGGAQHCDNLGTGGWTVGNIQSEYLALRAGQPVGFADYGLIEACFPETPDEVRLVLNDPNITVYIKDVLAPPQFTTLNRYQAFTTTSGAPGVGATYTDSTNFSGVTFYYIGVWNGQFMFSAGTNTPPYAGVNGKTAVGSGMLTLANGTGPSSIAYTASNIGFDQQYYTWYGLPPGHWVQVTGSNGVFQLSSMDLRSRVRRNKISFLLYESGGFYLSAPRIMYRSSQRRAIEERKTYYPGQSEFRPARGSELLAHNYTSNLTGWTVTGSLTPSPPSDAQMPQDPATGLAMTSCVTLSPGNYLTQAIAWNPTYEHDLEVEITIYARNFPALADPSSITQDTFDWTQLEIDLITNSGITAAHIDKVGLWWNEMKFRTILPLGDSAATIVIRPAGGASGSSTIEVAYASVRQMDA